MVATVLVVQTCQVRLFVEGWTLVVVVALTPRSDQCGERALDWGGETSPHTHFDVEIAQKDSTAYLCSPDEVCFRSSSPAGAARWLVEGSLLGFRDDMLFSLMVGGVAETRLPNMECGLTGSTCWSRLTQDNWMKELWSMGRRVYSRLQVLQGTLGFCPLFESGQLGYTSDIFAATERGDAVEPQVDYGLGIDRSTAQQLNRQKASRRGNGTE